MSKPKKKSTVGDPDFWRDYFAIEWDRIARHEQARLQFTSFVFAGSVAAMAIIAASEVSRPARWLVLAAVALINIVAVYFGMNSRRWVKFHQVRADKVLKRAAPDLLKLQSSVPKLDSNRSFMRAELLHRYIHLLVAVTAIALAHLEN